MTCPQLPLVSSEQRWEILFSQLSFLPTRMISNSLLMTLLQSSHIYICVCSLQAYKLVDPTGIVGLRPKSFMILASCLSSTRHVHL